MRDDLILAVAALRRAAPHEWANFMKAYEEHVRWTADMCVLADKDVQISQGIARQASWLRGLFTDADKRADRIKK